MKLCKHLFDATDQYAKQSKWTDIALLKLCLSATGVMIGLSIPKEKKNPVFIGAAIISVATMVPIMTKFLPILRKHTILSCTCHNDADAETLES